MSRLHQQLTLKVWMLPSSSVMTNSTSTSLWGVSSSLCSLSGYSSSARACKVQGVLQCVDAAHQSWGGVRVLLCFVATLGMCSVARHRAPCAAWRLNLLCNQCILEHV